MIFALLVGAEVAGLVGALLALPIAAVVRETVVYLRRHLVLEPWGSTEPAASIASRAPSLPGGRVSDTEEEREEVPSRS